MLPFSRKPDRKPFRMPSEASKDDFHTLGLEPGAKQAEVKHAYRILAKRWHPDRHQSKPYEIRAMAEEKFKEITEAYRRLSLDWSKTARPVKPPKPQTAGSAAPSSSRQPRATTVRKRTIPRIHPKQAALVICLAVFALVAYHFFPYPGAPDKMQAPQGTDENRADTPGARPSEDAADLESMLAAVPPESGPPPVPSPPLLQSGREPPKFFTVGSLSSEVLEVQGAPTRVQGQTWVYGLSEIEFRQGRVYRYNNFDGSLKVHVLPGNLGDEPAPAYITIGSTEDEVLRAQGTPTRIDRDRWFYGFAEVRFKDGRVKEYDNYFGTLKVRILPGALRAPGEPRPYFTIGSTPDDVIAAQGTPTSIKGNLWSFNFSTVFFRDGKVQYVSDSENILRFLPPEESGSGS